MSYVSLKDLLSDAKEYHYAVGAFNIFNYVTIKSIIAESEECHSPVILQTSVKTVKQLGINEIPRILIPMAKAARIPVVLHLDHCTDISFAKKCIDAGWSSIMYDGSALSLEENIKNTKDIVDYKDKHNISIEGELGAITGIEDDISVLDGCGSLADVESSVLYTAETNVDAFAPAIGTAHGIYKGTPMLDFERLKELSGSIETPLVIHGGTGLESLTFRNLITLGATKINISTAIKQTYINALKVCGQFYEPLKADMFIEAQIRRTVRDFIYIFGSNNRL